MLALTRNRVSGACVTASAMRSNRPTRLSSVTDRFSAGWIASTGVLSTGLTSAGLPFMEAAAAAARAAAPAAEDKAVRIFSVLSPPDSRRTPTRAGRERRCAGTDTWLLCGTWLEAPTAKSERSSVCLSLESQEVIRHSAARPPLCVRLALDEPLTRSSARARGCNLAGVTLSAERI